MGRTIPSFRIASILEEKTWKEYRKFLNINDRKVFDNLFKVATLYNSASSYAAIPIRIQPIMMSIVFHHYKNLKEKNNKIFESDQIVSSNNSEILKKELAKWKIYSDILRKPNRDLFNEMLLSANKYSESIDAKGKDFVTESLLMSLLFEQYKKLLQ
ncbi:MAG TPA: hypothetical protein VJ697_00945 [Nitrososphaeraceae archaeon]|nr:hypothetical protein [Nitrososphaeraceae archaeon]